VAITQVNIQLRKTRRPEPFAGAVCATRLESTTPRGGNGSAANVTDARDMN
jgi:hypothetical protein